MMLIFEFTITSKRECLTCMSFRDAEDHISWLLQHGLYAEALAATEAGQGRKELLDDVCNFF